VYDQVSGHWAGKSQTSGASAATSAGRSASSYAPVIAIVPARSGGSGAPTGPRTRNASGSPRASASRGRELADEADAHRPAREIGARLGVRMDDDRQRGKVAPGPYRRVDARRDDPRRTREPGAERAAPSRDVERPLRGAAREARVAARVVGLAAVAPLAAIEVVLRAVRIRIVQRDVERHAGVGRQLDRLARQAVDVVEVHPRDARAAQQRGERRAIARIAEPRVEARAVVRGRQVNDVAARGPEPQHLRAARERRRELVDVSAHAAAPAVTDEHDLRPRRGREAPERAGGIVGHGSVRRPPANRRGACVRDCSRTAPCGPRPGGARRRAPGTALFVERDDDRLVIR